MKKTLFTIALAVVTVLTANAQFYVGGGLGFESNSKGSTAGPQSRFSLSPEAGYYLNDKFSLGVELAFAFEKRQDNSKVTGFAFAPYVRYSLLQFGQFEVLGKGSLGIAVTSIKFDGGGESANTTTFGINVLPQLAYNLSDNFLLFADLNFASFHLSSVSPEQGDSITRFGLDVDTHDAFTTGLLQVGFIVKF